MKSGPYRFELGVASIAALDRPLAEVARAAAAAGLDGLEVTQRAPHLGPDDGPTQSAALGRMIRAEGIEVLAFGSYLGMEGATDGEAARRTVDMAVALETQRLRVWAESGAVGGDRDAAVALMRETCDAALVHGLDVVVERHLGSLADTPEHTEQLLVDVDRENFALNYQVLDLLPAEAIEAQPADAERLAPHARYFHLKNYLLDPDSGRLLHGASLAAGSLDYQAILAAALRAGYSGPLTIEFLSCEQQPLEQKLADDVSYLRGVLQTIGSRALP